MKLSQMILHSNTNFPTPELWYAEFVKEFPGMSLEEVTRAWPTPIIDLTTLQTIYDVLEDAAFADGVNGVGEWVKNNLEEHYKVVLTFDPEILNES